MCNPIGCPNTHQRLITDTAFYAYASCLLIPSESVGLCFLKGGDGIQSIIATVNQINDDLDDGDLLIGPALGNEVSATRALSARRLEPSAR
jgi:hypothetical protein